MGRKPRKKKKDPGYDPTTAKDPAPDGSKEVVEAVEKFDAEQAAEVANLLDEAPDNDFPSMDRNDPDDEDEKPSEQPAQSQEQESTPEAKDLEKETEAEAEEQPPEQAVPETEADVPESEPAKEETPAEPKEPEYLSGDRYGEFTVEVVTEDGAKQVPMKNLVTTYQQFPAIQRKYQELKPVMDLASKAQVNLNDVMPLLELGIQTYAKQQGIIEGSQPPVSGSVYQPSGVPGQYQGPFKDAETDEYYKEADPELHSTISNLYQMASGVSRVEAEINRLRQERHTPQSKGPTDEEVNKAFDGKIKAWSGDHTDYFTTPNIGEERLNAFKNFIVKSHAGTGLTMKGLTPEFLQAEFARFDPQYNLAYMQKLAQNKAGEAKNDSGMFAEGTGVRTQAAPLDEQQEHMADML